MAPAVAVWLAVFLALLPDHFALYIPSTRVTHHSNIGYSLILPLSGDSFNHTLVRRRDGRLLSQLSTGNVKSNARMGLYDDLLTKGYYSTRLWIGSPPHEFALIVDTGSTVTYVPCLSCTQCGNHQDPRFNPEASSTYKPQACGPQCSCDMEKLQCKYERHYAEQSTSKGLLGSDIISFGNNSSFEPKRLVFGCETAETGDIYDQKADGIMGLGRGSLSIIDQLVAKNVITASFSLCYGGMDEGGGAMIIGAIPSPPDMIFTHSDFSRSVYYNLALEQVSVGGTKLPLDRGIFDSNFGTVLDSGTTYAYFPNKAFEVFKRTLMEHVKLHQIPGPDSHYPDICFEGAGSDYSKLFEHFPEVKLKFGDGKVVSLAPENYLFKHLKVDGGYCLGVFANGKDSGTLLGGIVVRNMLVTYDQVNKQIGFMRTNCSNLWNSLQGNLPSGPAAGSPLSPLSPEKSAESSNTSDSTCISGNVEVTLYLNMNSTAFIGSVGELLVHLAQDMQVDISQVSFVNYSMVGSTLNGVFSVHLAATNDQLLKVQAENIITRLNNHNHLYDDYGPYKVANWKLILSSPRSSNHLTNILISVVVFLLLLSIGTIILWLHIRSKTPKYVAIQQSVEMSDQL